MNRRSSLVFGEQALERHVGSKPKAADEFGISLKTLYNKLERGERIGEVGVAVAGREVATLPSLRPAFSLPCALRY